MASVEALCATLVTLDCPSQISEAQCVTDLYDGYSEDAESCPDEVNAFIACLAGKDASDFECNDELAWRKDGVCEAEDTVKDACEDGN